MSVKEEWRKDLMFWEGFDAAIDLVLNYLATTDILLPAENELQDAILEEVDLFKKGG